MNGFYLAMFTDSYFLADVISEMVRSNLFLLFGVTIATLSRFIIPSPFGVTVAP